MRVAGNPAINLHNFTFDQLAPFKREKSFPQGDSPDVRIFYVGRDDVHGVLKWLLARCTRSLKFNQFGYDDDELDAIIRGLVEDKSVFVQGTLDKSQAGGVHERKILATWTPAMRASFAVGQSATHQISHTKGGVIDGLIAWEGSTNWSASGEGTGTGTGEPDAKGVKAQNNTLAIITHPVQVTTFAAELDEEHAVAMHQQQHA